MSEYCRDCGTTIHEDDISLCPKCAARRGGSDNLIERAEACADKLSRIDCSHKDASEGAALIRDLLAVVKRLPRDANGNPLVPGDEVRLVGMEGTGEIDYAGAYDKVLVNDSRRWPDTDIKMGVLCMRDSKSLTRTAAEQARKAGA